jgi:hypothetical protein
MSERVRGVRGESDGSERVKGVRWESDGREVMGEMEKYMREVEERGEWRERINE